MNIESKWNNPENQSLLKQLIQKFGKYKYIQIVGWNGERKYYKVSTKRIITKGVKASELLDKKYGQEIKEKVYESGIQEQKDTLV